MSVQDLVPERHFIVEFLLGRPTLCNAEIRYYRRHVKCLYLMGRLKAESIELGMRPTSVLRWCRTSPSFTNLKRQNREELE